MRKKFGPITVLVNNAAHDDRHTLEGVTPEYFDDRIAVNLKHQFFAIQEVVPDMKKAKNGSIICMTSGSWLVGYTGLPVYTAAKAGIVGMMRGLGKTLGPDNIRINAIAPGWIITERQLKLWHTPEAEKQVIGQQALTPPHGPAGYRALGAVPGLRRFRRLHQPDHRRRRRLALASQ